MRSKSARIRSISGDSRGSRSPLSGPRKDSHGWACGAGPSAGGPSLVLPPGRSGQAIVPENGGDLGRHGAGDLGGELLAPQGPISVIAAQDFEGDAPGRVVGGGPVRSEERRVGEEGR